MKKLLLLSLVLGVLMSSCSTGYKYVGKQSRGQMKWLRNNKSLRTCN